MKSMRSRYQGHRFPPEIIGYAVWVYHRFCLSFRDVEDLLAERGIIVSYQARMVKKLDLVWSKYSNVLKPWVMSSRAERL